MAPQSPSPATPPPLPRPTEDADWSERLEYWRQHILDAVGPPPHPRFVIGVAVLLVVGSIALLTMGSGETPPPLEASLPFLEAGEVTPAPEPSPSVIVVHVAGAVQSPGLVELGGGTRVADAVAAAGGPTAEADLDRINLALPLVDADRVYVPVVGEALLPTDVAGVSPPEASGPLDLNRATAEQLDALPGVGPATAAAIIAYRDANGPFTSVSALENVPGIGPAKMARLRELVSARS